MNGDGSAEESDTFFEDGDAELKLIVLENGVGIEALAVVLDVDVILADLLLDDQVNLVGVCVLLDIDEALLDHSIDRDEDQLIIAENVFDVVGDVVLLVLVELLDEFDQE